MREAYLSHITILEETKEKMVDAKLNETFPARFFALEKLIEMAHHFKKEISLITQASITYQSVSDYTAVMARVIAIEPAKILSKDEIDVDDFSVEDILGQMNVKSHKGYGVFGEYAGLWMLDDFSSSSSYDLGYSYYETHIREQLIRFPTQGLAHSFTYLEAAYYGITFETVFGVDRMNVDFSEDKGLADVMMHDRQHEHILLQGLRNQFDYGGLEYIEEAREYMSYLSAFINHIEPGVFSSLKREELFSALTAVVFNYYHEGLGGRVPHPEQGGNWEKDLMRTLDKIFKAEDKFILFPMSAHVDEDFEDLGPSPRKAIAEAIKVILKFNEKYRTGKVQFLDHFVDRY